MKGSVHAEVAAYVDLPAGAIELEVSAIESAGRRASWTEMLDALREARNVKHAVVQDFLKRGAMRR